MARKPRIHRSLAFYHVMLRGNNRQQIFFSNGDKIRFCLLIQEGIERFEHRVHGFCLMSNHVHLIIQTANIPLSQIIHHLASRYAKYLNYKEGRVGHVFQERFKAILIDAENYLSELIRYVHLNPVRANLVSAPKDYPWSSHRSYLGLDKITWLSQEWILCKFHTYEMPARKIYNEYVRKGIGEAMRPEFYLEQYDGCTFGDEDFIPQVVQKRNNQKKAQLNCSLEELVNGVAHELQIPASVLTISGKQRVATKARGIVAYLARNTTTISLKELANFFDRDTSVLNKLAVTIEQKVLVDQNLADSIENIRLRLQQHRCQAGNLAICE